MQCENDADIVPESMWLANLSTMLQVRFPNVFSGLHDIDNGGI